MAVAYALRVLEHERLKLASNFRLWCIAMREMGHSKKDIQQAASKITTVTSRRKV
jgi:hypothetical protein